MRKNHHGKKDRLVKRVFALCLALAVICTCLVPVFATEYNDVVDSGNEEAAGLDGDFPAVEDGEAAGLDGDFPAVDDGEAAGLDGDFPAVDDSDWPAVDDGEAAGFGEDEATRPVEGEGGEDNPGEGGTVKETEWGTVIEYGPSTETQWSGEDDVVEKPVDKEVVSGDQIKELQDMVVYRFWLKELNSNDLQDITAQAQVNNMTESEYLARYGETLWNLYFIQAVPRIETIADYSSYINTPSSNRDPKGELRQFDYWYTLDEFGNRVRLNLTDPTSNILDDKTTTVNVYAAWKDGTVGSDEEEDVDHEDLVDKNPVPVDLTAKAPASYEDEDGNTKSATLPVEVKNLPSAADHLSVIHMGDDDMESFYESHEDSFGEMMPILGLKISPKNAKGETVQPAKGDVATVTVSGLDKLPEMEGATASTLKVLHQKDDKTVEKLDVVSYENGTLTFETSSFSPFVVVRTDGYDTELLYDKPKDPITISVGEEKTIEGWWLSSRNHSWKSSNNSVVSVKGDNDKATITGEGTGKETITHEYDYFNFVWQHCIDEYTVTVTDWEQEAGLFILYSPTGTPDSNADSQWTSIVQVDGENAKLGSLEGAIWDSKQKNIFFRDNGGADGDNAKQYIKYWPDGVQYDGPRVLDPKNPKNPKDNTFRQVTVNGTTLEKLILQQYKSDLKDKYKDKGFNGEKVDDLVDKLEANEITITITPHKISKNVPKPQMHIDCTVTVTCDLAFTARFNAKTSAGSYTTFDNEVYLWDKTAENTVTKCKTNPGEFTDKDGVTWVFDGWCLEDVTTGNEPGENAPVISDAEWRNYIVNENVLTNGGGDRVVNFYAHYRKATSNVTITKKVTGLLGDTQKNFTFNVSITTKDGKVYSNDVTAKKGNDTVPLNNFTLKHNEFVTLENVPIGATITVTEVNPGDHYTVSANGKAGVEDASGNVTFTYVAVANTPTTTANDTGEAALMLLSMDEDTAVDADGDAVAYDSGIEVDNNQIIVTNHCGLIPDTGVLLDTLPYIVILAVVAGGVALLMLRKHRKEDD